MGKSKWQKKISEENFTMLVSNGPALNHFFITFNEKTQVWQLNLETAYGS